MVTSPLFGCSADSATGGSGATAEVQTSADVAAGAGAGDDVPAGGEGAPDADPSVAADTSAAAEVGGDMEPDTAGLFPGACLTDADCTGADGSGRRCAGGVCGCSENSHCTSPTAPVCVPIDQGVCLGCGSSGDCDASPVGGACIEGHCVKCTSNEDCSLSGLGHRCDPTTGKCGCATSDDCAGTAGQECITIDRDGASAQVCG